MCVLEMTFSALQGPHFRAISSAEEPIPSSAMVSPVTAAARAIGFVTALRMLAILAHVNVTPQGLHSALALYRQSEHADLPLLETADRMARDIPHDALNW